MIGLGIYQSMAGSLSIRYCLKRKGGGEETLALGFRRWSFEYQISSVLCGGDSRVSDFAIRGSSRRVDFSTCLCHIHLEFWVLDTPLLLRTPL